MWCRLCLALINDNMSPISDMELKLFIKKVFEQYGFNKNIEEHDFACWACKALVKKSYNFFKRVFKAQQELLNIIRTHKKVNLQLLNTIHRQELSFDVNLSCKKTSIDYFIHEDVKVEFIDDNDDNNRQDEKPSTSQEFDAELDAEVKTEKPDQVFEQNMIDIVDNEISVEHFESVDDTGSIAENKNSAWSDTEKVVNDEDECYVSPGEVEPSEHSVDTYSVEDPFNELARTTETKNVVETNSSVPGDFDPKKVNLLSDIEFTKMIKRRNVKSSRIDYKTLLPSSSDTDSGNEREIINKHKRRPRRDRSEDDDFVPEKAPAATTSESSEDSFDDEGKPIKRPKDRRVYPMQCDHCEAEIFEKKTHYRHYLIYHPDIEYPYMLKKQFLCQYCGKGYRQNSSRNQHEQIHRNQRTFQCPVCPKKFLNTTQMVKHKYNVHGEAKYICDYCGRSTKTRGAFVFHMRSHTGEKPYNCHICNAAFSHHAYRISHIKHAHGQNGRQTDTAKPTAMQPGETKTKGAAAKRGRKKANAKKDGDPKRKQRNVATKRDKKKRVAKKSREIPDANEVDKNKVIPTEQKKNIKEITTRKRMDSASSEDEILAVISNKEGPTQKV